MRWLDGDVLLEMLGRILFSIQIAHIKKETNSNCTYNYCSMDISSI